MVLRLGKFVELIKTLNVAYESETRRSILWARVHAGLLHGCKHHASAGVNQFTAMPLTLANRLDVVGFAVLGLPPGYAYYPAGNGTGPCICSTVTFSMISACGLCQNDSAGT